MSSDKYLNWWICDPFSVIHQYLLSLAEKKTFWGSIIFDLQMHLYGFYDGYDGYWGSLRRIYHTIINKMTPKLCRMAFRIIIFHVERLRNVQSENTCVIKTIVKTCIFSIKSLLFIYLLTFYFFIFLLFFSIFSCDSLFHRARIQGWFIE